MMRMKTQGLKNKVSKTQGLELYLTIFFYTLYFWTTAFVSHLVISYYDFLFLFAPSYS
jgi:hypothetical protein